MIEHLRFTIHFNFFLIRDRPVYNYIFVGFHLLRPVLLNKVARQKIFGIFGVAESFFGVATFPALLTAAGIGSGRETLNVMRRRVLPCRIFVVVRQGFRFWPPIGIALGIDRDMAKRHIFILRTLIARGFQRIKTDLKIFNYFIIASVCFDAHMARRTIIIGLRMTNVTGHIIIMGRVIIVYGFQFTVHLMATAFIACRQQVIMVAIRSFFDRRMHLLFTVAIHAVEKHFAMNIIFKIMPDARTVASGAVIFLIRRFVKTMILKFGKAAAGAIGNRHMAIAAGGMATVTILLPTLLRALRTLIKGINARSQCNPLLFAPQLLVHTVGESFRYTVVAFGAYIIAIECFRWVQNQTGVRQFLIIGFGIVSAVAIHTGSQFKVLVELFDTAAA